MSEIKYVILDGDPTDNKFFWKMAIKEHDMKLVVLTQYNSLTQQESMIVLCKEEIEKLLSLYE